MRAGENTETRISRLVQKMLVLPALCTERGRIMTESYKETEGGPPVIRRAKALAKVLDGISLHIDEGELIVGRPTSKQRGGALIPELNAQWVLNEMDTMSTREWDRFAPVSDEEKAEIRELLPYWQGRSLDDLWKARVPEDKQRLYNKGFIIGANYATNSLYPAHMAPDYEKILTRGLKGIQDDIAEAMKDLDLVAPEDLKKYQFYKAARITLDAACRFAERYAGFAETLAEAERDSNRKEELQKIAATCRKVPAGPAGTFFEALQSIYFVWMVIMLEGWGHGNSFGRPDQYLYYFYKKDMAEGRLTVDEARELIGLLYIKANATVTLDDSMAASIFAGFPQTVNITLGGLTRDGKDAVNDLSYLFVEADLDVRMTMEDIIIRVHKNTPDAFIVKACEVAKALRGKLKFLSDETAIQQMLNDGYPIEHARDYIITGCNSPSTPGHSFDVPGGMSNLPLMLELALNNGRMRCSGELIGPETGDPGTFASYDDLWQAYRKQVEYFINLTLIYVNADRQLFAEFAPTPFLSSLFNGPIQKGRDIHDGGTFPYGRQAISLSGAPNVGDSLAAVKKLVFEEKKITMDCLLAVLDRNFEGEDEILHMVSRAPKFGNDDDYVDGIVNDVLLHAASAVGQYKAFCGTPFNVAAAVVTANIPLGAVVGALPDGRRKGQPLSEGGISPCHGRNVSGPTATMKSVAKLDHVKVTNGSVLNMRFNPSALNGEANLRRFASLIRTFCETGGFLVQFNIVDAETLRAAQREPEKYKDLLVRVATYSAYFVELSPEMQEDVIGRTEFSEV